jgi:hypothetical protein
MSIFRADPTIYRGSSKAVERLRGPSATFGEMRDSGVRGILVYCADYHCSYSVAMSAEHRTDDVRLSDIEARFVCKPCGRRGADVRPDFNWTATQVGGIGYR